MKPFEADVVFDLAQNVQAWRALHDPEIGGRMGADEVLQLCKDAGYSEQAAQAAAKTRAEQRLDQGLPVFNTTFVHQ